MARRNRFLSSRRGKVDERLFRAWKEFSWTIVCYIVMVVVVVLFGRIGEYDLSQGSVNGFALWYLLLPAYLPLWIIGIFAWAFHLDAAAWFTGREAVALGSIDIVMALIIWLSVTIASARTRQSVVPHTARNFMRILIFWGVFQLACAAMVGLWEYGGLASLHRDPVPANVTSSSPDRP